MKPRQIRRGIESRHTRDLGNAPRLGKVHRMRESDRVRSKLRGGESPLRQHQRLILTILSSLVVAGVLLAGVWVGFRFRSRFVPTALPAAAGRHSEEHVRIASSVKSPSEEEALALVARALECRDEQSAAARLRLGDTKAADAVRFLMESGADEIDRKRMQWMGSVDIEGLLMEGVQIHSLDKQIESGRIAFLVPDEQGIWKLDFDAFARACKPAWKAVLNGTPAPAKVRIWATPDSYYNGGFSDESQWRCFGITSPDVYTQLPEEKRLMYGYCRKDSPQSRALDRVLSAGNQLLRLTLEIKRAEGGEKIQFEILRVLSEDWVMTAKPFDERFQ